MKELELRRLAVCGRCHRRLGEASPNHVLEPAEAMGVRRICPRHPRPRDTEPGMSRRNLVTLSRQMEEAGFPHAFDHDPVMEWWTERNPRPGRARLRVTAEEIEELKAFAEAAEEG